MPCGNKGIVVKLIEPITSKDQKLVKIVAKSRTFDHTLKIFSLTFNTHPLSGLSCPILCHCHWLVPFDEWPLACDVNDSYYGIPPPGNGLPFALWWGRDIKSTDKQRWLHVGDTCSLELSGLQEFIPDYDHIPIMVAGIVPADNDGSASVAWDKPGCKYQV